MSLPHFSTQSELFSTAALSARLFGPADPYRLFAQRVYPHLVRARPALEKCYCAENGRKSLEPVLMLGVSILQHLDGVPDRQAVEMLRYHAGWNFALNRQLGDETFHPTSLVNFRSRLAEHDQSALGFRTILDALVEAGWVSRRSRQRLDSTQMLARVARMNRLDCVRESLRLALRELEGEVGVESRPGFWGEYWERYVESKADYQLSAERLGRKLAEAGADAWRLLQWLRGPAVPAQWAAGEQTGLLARVFGEQFQVVAGQPQALPQEPQVPVESGGGPDLTDPIVKPAPTAEPESEESVAEAGESAVDEADGPPSEAPAAAGAPSVEPKGKGQLDSNRVQNPHDPDATYAVKGQGQQKKEHVGYKVQVAETVCEAVLEPGEPTRNFLTGIVTQPAYESDEAGARLMDQEQGAMGLEKPPVQYVDGAYISAQRLVEVEAEGRELIGPAQPAPRKGNRYTVEDFDIQVEERRAVCPAGKRSTQCSRLEEEATGRVSYRFEFRTHCQGCAFRRQCVGKEQRHRTIVVGEHHTVLQGRRRQQQTEPFQHRMKHRNAIEGTQSELVRGHGLRQARYRGLEKVRLQNDFIGAACNVKRWIRHEVWQLEQGMRRILSRAGAPMAL